VIERCRGPPHDVVDVHRAPDDVVAVGAAAVCAPDNVIGEGAAPHDVVPIEPGAPDDVVQPGPPDDVVQRGPPHDVVEGGAPDDGVARTGARRAPHDV